MEKYTSWCGNVAKHNPHDSGSTRREGQLVTRRQAVSSAVAAAASLTILPAGLARGYSANEKISLGVIGAGGRGWANTQALAKAGAEVAALCDVDRNRLESAKRKYTQARTYTDFRELLTKEKGLDAVVVSTPDHTHAPASIMAMQQGLHCYCEKPLTHNVYEARRMAEVAAAKKVITHMGTGAQSDAASIRTVEAIRAGHIGDVIEAHCWTNRPIWPQGAERPPGEDPVPKHLDWNLWLGPAPLRPYKAEWPKDHWVVKRWKHRQVYHPFVWRGWWDFGTGALGDIAPHIMNVVFWALELGAPSAVEVVDTSGMKPEMFPVWSIIRFEFPGKAGKPGLKLYWYDGDKLPPADLIEGTRGHPILFVGTKGRLRVGDTPVPREQFKDYQWPEPTLPRRDEIHREWLKCIKESREAGCPFSYAGPMTEAYLLGNIALRVGQRIEWDPAAFRITNCERANQYLRREYRKGWEDLV